MKKFFIILFFFIFFVSIRSSNFFVNDNLDNDYSYNLHTLSFENLSTNNIFDYFSNINIVKIYPYVNPIYSNKIGELFYEVRGYDLSNEINNFREKYLNIIKKNSYSDYNYLYTNGINISKMDVYLSDNDLYDIINSGLLVYVVK